MWAGGKDTNEAGESVLLLEPSSTKPSNSKKKCDDPCASFLGGIPSFFEGEEMKIDVHEHVRECVRERERVVDRPKCGICKRETYLILQMNAPFGDLDRTMYVFGCNNASCLSAAFDSGQVLSSSSSSSSSSSTDDDITGSRFCIGGKGVIYCIRSQTEKHDEISTAVTAAAVSAVGKIDALSTKEDIQNKKKFESAWEDDTMSWGDTGGTGWGEEDDDDNDDWGMSSRNVNTIADSTTSMDDLEAMLTAMETTNENNEKHAKKAKPNKTSLVTHHESHTGSQNTDKGADRSADAGPSFPRYDLTVYDEPASKNMPHAGHDEIDSDDDDDEVMNDKSDAKIQKLLSKYLKEEEDTDILSAIKGGGVGGGKGGSAENSGEKYERLPPKDRAFMSFSTRVKRAPKQSVRYAYDGIPLWSIPVPLTAKGKRGGQSRDTDFPYNHIPPCPCGSQRAFEFQLMPSILHTLDVDRYSQQTNGSSNHDLKSNKKNSIDCVMRKDYGGMNWGTIAVFSCARSCKDYRDEFIIIQESVDASPKKRELKKPPDDDK